MHIMSRNAMINSVRGPFTLKPRARLIYEKRVTLSSKLKRLNSSCCLAPAGSSIYEHGDEFEFEEIW